MDNELFINVSSTEITIALLEDKRLVEFHKEKNDNNFSVGDIYLGKVKKIMPGLNAAFIDIGFEKDAFLHYHDLGPQFRTATKFIHQFIHHRNKSLQSSKIHPEPDINKDGKITEVLAQGQYIMVQIVKEPISSKGPRLTAEVSLAGRNLILMPFSNKVSVSQKIESRTERERLKKSLYSIKPNNYGVILRTAAENKKIVELDNELRLLVKRWEDTFKIIKQITFPMRILSEINRTSAILRDILNPSFNNIYIDNETIYNEVKQFIHDIAPDKENIVRLYKSEIPIFENFGINKQLKTLFGKMVPMKHGTYLVIEHTEAMHSIDVNSGNRSYQEKDQETNAVDVNLIAAEEIARQLRLRDMGGLIVIDFIDMQQQEHRQMVFDKMREAMARDRAKHQVLQLSKFGLMQITRQRVRPERHIETNEICPTCHGNGKINSALLIIDEIERNIAKLTEKFKNRSFIMRAHPFVAAYFNQGFFSIALKWLFRFRRRFKIQPDHSYSILEYRFFDSEGTEIPID